MVMMMVLMTEWYGLLSDTEDEDPAFNGGLFRNDEELQNEEVDNETFSEDPPLLKVMRLMLQSLSTEQLSSLLVNWAVLVDRSKIVELGSASGCTGSGMDWWVLKLLCEASLT